MNVEKIAGLAREAVAESDSPATTIYLLRAGGPASPSSVARVGGDPIGIDETDWPTCEDEPMDHLVTLDLEQMPALCVGPLAAARAVSLFISDRTFNEAFMPDNDEATIVVLTAADVGRGAVPPARPAEEPAAALEVTAVEVPPGVFSAGEPGEPKLAALWAELYDASAYAGGQPMWLQSPEHEGHFILQFDEAFIDVNLGDAGVMYAFADTAFWQCH